MQSISIAEDHERRDQVTRDALEEAGWSQEEIDTMLVVGRHWKVAVVSEPTYNVDHGQIFPDNPWNMNLAISNGTGGFAAPKTVMVLFPKDTPVFKNWVPKP